MNRYEGVRKLGRMQWRSESLEKKTTALLRTCPLRTRSRNCRTLHATRQRYSLQAIEDNGGLSTLRGTLSWLDMSPVASGIQAAISRSYRPSNQPSQSPFTHFLLFKATTSQKSERLFAQPAFSCIDEKSPLITWINFTKETVTFRCRVNLHSFLILIRNIFKFC